MVGGNDYSTYDVSTSSAGNSRLTMKPSAMAELKTRTLNTSIDTIRERIDKLGVSEPTIQKYGLGENEILVELPGFDDPPRWKRSSNRRPSCRFMPLRAAPTERTQTRCRPTTGSFLRTPCCCTDMARRALPDQVWLLKRVSEVEGTDFRDAQPSTDQNGRPNIHFNLTTEAGDRFYKYTSTHSKSSSTPGSMAIVLDNKVREVAGIDGAIRDSGEITGGFTKQQAADLSLMLRTGALPASISYLETRTVGPSLGAASIHQGVIAAIVGMVAVMIFMLIYYRGAGINADLALILNLVILLGFMGFAGATLTLAGHRGSHPDHRYGRRLERADLRAHPGRAATGKSTAAAVQQGFAHAWITILDTHVTTIVSAAILFLFGTGPVQGFAVTLIFGLLANLFTAVFVSRVIFEADATKERTRRSVVDLDFCCERLRQPDRLPLRA